MRHAEAPRAAKARGWHDVLVWVGLLLGATVAHAGGPRFVSGQGWGVYPGNAIGWGTTTLLYATDPGPLSPTVTHAQADAMVAAAAAVWNVPTSSLTLAQGGSLAEDVSTANISVSGTSVVFPADVQVSNEGNIPVAIVYDANGGIIDALLGAGASEPDGCRQNAVAGDVDDIHHADGHIHHATLILNGRCVGSAPEQLTEMQYHLARAFGRVLGLAWSQLNENVFTGQSTITPQQMAYWPLMHPIDVICGTYAYQCMSNPFTLRVDDLSALGSLYPVWQSNPPAGKQPTSNDALWMYGALFFPTGQGMNLANFTTRRQTAGVTEDWELTSGVSGYLYQQALANPVTGVQTEDSGTTDPFYEGTVIMRRIPLNGLANVFMTSEPVNPLYTGEYALAPYVRPLTTPSGSPQTIVAWSALPAGDALIGFTVVAGDASNTCATGNDGRESLPVKLDGSGWQNGLLCAWQHTSWWITTAAAGHSWTVEVAATDETGVPTTAKAQPVIGIWNASDATGTAPTLASAPVAFNSMALGVTQIHGSASSAARTLRIVVGDQFGAGRPDFSYTARMFYAAAVSPATVGSSGGQITISGTGFRTGNQVAVNGVPATVLSWTSTQIVATAPSMSLAGARTGRGVTVLVTDPSTGATTAISSAISYLPTPDLVQVVSAPVAVFTGVPSAVPFAVRVLTSDGSAPVAGAMVRFAVAAGSASLAACNGAASCTLTTNSSGLAQTTVQGAGAGTFALTATEQSGGGTVQVTVLDSDAPRLVGLSKTTTYIAAGADGTWTLQLGALQAGLPAAGLPVNWTASAGLQVQSSDHSTGVDGVGKVTVAAAAVPAGFAGTLTGCVWTNVCATWTLHGVDPSHWQVSLASGAGQSVSGDNSFAPIAFTVTDGAGNAVQGAPVKIFQRVLAWEGDCSGEDRCATAPVLASSQTILTSDAAGSLTVNVLQLPGMPQVVQVAASTGTLGFVTATMVKTP